MASLRQDASGVDVEILAIEQPQGRSPGHVELLFAGAPPDKRKPVWLVDGGTSYLLSAIYIEARGDKSFLAANITS